MPKTAKVAISLSEELLLGVEKERRARGETRSEFFRHALEAFLRRERERQAIEQYIRGYQEYPETEEEVAMVQSTVGDALANSPWEAGEEH